LDKQTILNIDNLHAGAESIEILKGITLRINAGEVHAIMGPNGSGKSTLSRVLSGHPDYVATSGSIEFMGAPLLELETHERAHKGVFMGFQYPVEIPGVNNLDFLKMAIQAKRKGNGLPELSAEELSSLIQTEMQALSMTEKYQLRDLNSGFSGGEKKRNEILQLLTLKPTLAILDETDSGLDIDALRIVSEGINRFRSSQNAVLLITHYQRLLDYVKPDFVHVMSAGKIVESAGAELALELEADGYAKWESNE
jgi:Fe-S cluster assembly ATP-binding protein